MNFSQFKYLETSTTEDFCNEVHSLFCYLNLELIFLNCQLLFNTRPQFFYNNLTTCHKELQVFLKLVDNNRVIHVIHQDILDQLPEYSLLEYFH